MKIEMHKDEESWLEARKQSLGGSDQAARLLWRGDMYFWLRKNPAARKKFRAEIAEEDEREREKASVNMPARKALEPVIESWLAEARGIEIVDPGDYCILRSDNARWHYSPDGLVGDLYRDDDRLMFINAGPILESCSGSTADLKGVAEYKTVSPYAAWKWDDEPDLYATLQIQSLYAWPDAGDWAPAILAAFIGYGDGPNDRLIYDVEPNPDLIELIQESTERFWRYVKEDKPPPPDGFEDTKRSIDIIYRARRKGHKTTITLGTPWIAKDLEHQRLVREIDQLERKRKQIEQEIAVEMGQNDAALAAVPADENQPGRTWLRVETEVKESLCDCGAVKRRGYTYTKTQPLKG